MLPWPGIIEIMADFLSKLFGYRKRPRQPAVKPGELRRNHFANPASWSSVQSSNVAAIAYYTAIQNGEESVLGVRFLNGSEYHYYGVKPSVYQDMLSASSKGRFVWQQLRDQYPYERVK